MHVGLRHIQSSAHPGRHYTFADRFFASTLFQETKQQQTKTANFVSESYRSVLFQHKTDTHSDEDET